MIGLKECCSVTKWKSVAMRKCKGLNSWGIILQDKWNPETLNSEWRAKSRCFHCFKCDEQENWGNVCKRKAAKLWLKYRLQNHSFAFGITCL